MASATAAPPAAIAMASRLRRALPSGPSPPGPSGPPGEAGPPGHAGSPYSCHTGDGGGGGGGGGTGPYWPGAPYGPGTPAYRPAARKESAVAVAARPGCPPSCSSVHSAESGPSTLLIGNLRPLGSTRPWPAAELPARHRAPYDSQHRLAP